MTYEEWAAMFPVAADVLATHVMTDVAPDLSTEAGSSEAARQQDIRFSIAQQGHFAWRNNVGATPARCKSCGEPQQPVRYGIANESEKQNGVFKSSDLLLGIKRVIESKHVGTTMLQLGFAECKPRGWTFTGKGREGPQANWINFINMNGGFARFASEPFKI